MSASSERSLIGRLASHESWARTEDRSARTAPARRAMLDRFERQVDPDGVLTTDERARRAANARKAHFTRLALKSAQARRRAAEARNAVPLLEAEADAADAELAADQGVA